MRNWTSPYSNNPRNRPLEVRVWERIERRGEDECWPWIGRTTNRGYGQLHFRGKCRPSHRLVLEVVNGAPLPDDMFVDHICRNRRCNNPKHLRVVTARQNALENNDTPFMRNALKTECLRGHPLAGENLAIKACTGPKGTPMLTRICLTCWPETWMYAVIERGPPPGKKARVQWRGPQQKRARE